MRNVVRSLLLASVALSATVGCGSRLNADMRPTLSWFFGESAEESETERCGALAEPEILVCPQGHCKKEVRIPDDAYPDGTFFLVGQESGIVVDTGAGPRREVAKSGGWLSMNTLHGPIVVTPFRAGDLKVPKVKDPHVSLARSPRIDLSDDRGKLQCGKPLDVVVGTTRCLESHDCP